MQPFGHSREFLFLSLIFLPQGRRPFPVSGFFLHSSPTMWPCQPSSSLVSLKLHFSLSYPPSLSLSLTAFSFSLSLSFSLFEIKHLGGQQHTPPSHAQKETKWRTIACQHGDISVSSRWSACKDDHDSDKKWRPPVSFGGQAWFQRVQHTLFIIMVTSIRDESGQIIGILFRTNWKNFNSWSEPNRALFWGKDLIL